MQILQNLVLLLFTLSACETTLAQNALSYESVDEQTSDSIQYIINQVEQEQLDSVRLSYENLLLHQETSLQRDFFFPLLRGLLQTSSNHDFNRRNGIFKSYHHADGVDYIPAVSPLAVCYVLKGVGLESRSKSTRFYLAQSIALALSTGITQGLKHSVSENRPTGNDNQSFPSGHTSLAFTCATLLHREYGFLSPWVSVGGYGAATLTEVLRLRHNAHYINDIFVGAGIGVASTNLAYYLTDCFLHKNAIRTPNFTDKDAHRIIRFNSCPHSFYLLSGSEITKKSFYAKDFIKIPINVNFQVRSSSTYTSGIGVDYFLSPTLALDARIRLGITRLRMCSDNTKGNDGFSNMSGENLNEYHFGVGLTYSRPVISNMRVGIRISAGDDFNGNVTFKNVDTGQNIAHLSAAHRFECGGGLNVDLLSTTKYITSLMCDYSHIFGSVFSNRLTVTSSWKILF